MHVSPENLELYKPENVFVKLFYDHSGKRLE